MSREFYKITYRDKGFNYEEPFLFNCYDMEFLDTFIKRFIAHGYYDIKVYKVIEAEELIKEIKGDSEI